MEDSNPEDSATPSLTPPTPASLKSRRWSFDIISPKKLFGKRGSFPSIQFPFKASRRGSSPAVSPEAKNAPEPLIALPPRGRRGSSPAISPAPASGGVSSRRRGSLPVLQIPTKHGLPPAFHRRRGSMPNEETSPKQSIFSSLQRRRQPSPASSVKEVKAKHRHRDKKESYLLLFLDNDETEMYTCENDHELKSRLISAKMDQRVRSYRAIVASSRAILKMEAGLPKRSKSFDDLLDIEDDDQEETEDGDSLHTDRRYRLVHELLEGEKRYSQSLHSLFDVYAEPLRKFSSLSVEDHKILFTPPQPLCSLSASLLTKLESALQSWDSQSTRIGNLFSSNLFWAHYQGYYTGYCEAKKLLLEKHKTDPTFVEFCETKIKQGKPSLDALLALPVKRIPDYDRYLSGLLEETDPTHQDYDDLSKAAKRVHSMVKERENELYHADNQTAMEAVQDRFPHDDLQLQSPTSPNNNSNNNIDNADNNNGSSSTTNGGNNNNDNNVSNNNNEDKDKPSNKSKGLSLRRRSAPSAVLFKSLTTSKSKSTNSLWSNAGMGRKDHDVIHQFKVADTDSNRMFVMEGPVQLATGMQIQERYLFLFSDLLLVAKQKSNTAFKLKHKVQLRDMWIASCIEEVSETTRPTDRSFVIGWPTTNVVATFPKAEAKEDWVTKLSQNITAEKVKDEGKTLQLKVAPKDIGSSACTACHISINCDTAAAEVLLKCLDKLHIPEEKAKDYQLWVLSGKEGSAYPLIGHETPFSIKLSHVQGLSRSRSRDDIDNMTSGDIDSVVESSQTAGQKCEFYLRQKKTPKKHQLETSTLQKSMKRQKGNFLNTLIRKIRPAQNHVFGLPLHDICDENFDPPESIIKLMVLVYQKGPDINGILRRGNKAALGKEIKEKINSGAKYEFEDDQAPTVATAASVFKEFLRSIPEGLIQNQIHPEWSDIKPDDPEDQKIQKIKSVLDHLPPQHYRLVKLTICLLQHLAKHQEVNKMGANNLATCIAPSFCASEGQVPHHGKQMTAALKQAHSSMMAITSVFTPLISFMITKHTEIFGEDILDMFVKYGCEASPHLSLDEDKHDHHVHASGEEDEEDEEEMMGGEEGYDEDDEHFENQQLRQRQQRQQRQHLQRDSNSGTDSDSTHSVLSMHYPGMGYRRDDSSIDSLVDRDYYPNEQESSPKATKSHLSPSNLSRDSGLTLSDTQLNDDDTGPMDMACTTKYQRSASHHYSDQYDTEMMMNDYYSQSIDGRRINPVPPPRKRGGGKKGRESSDGSDSEQHGFTPVQSSQRPPFKHSASTTQLDIHPRRGRAGDLKPMLTHPPLNKRVSSDSIGEEDETTEELSSNSMDFQSMRNSSDMGTIVKSNSGTHLFLSGEEQSTKYNLNAKSHRFMRQSSVTDSTPPISPQSRYSHSSRDSVISDSTYSMSRDGSVYSAPQTPDESQNNALNWVPDISLPGKPWTGRFSQSLNISTSQSLSKSTSDLLDRDDEDDDDENNSSSSTVHEQLSKFSPYKPTPYKLWTGKSHEAEEVYLRNRPHFSLMIQPESPTKATSPTSPQYSGPAYRKQSLPSQLAKGSPPPNVILQSLQSPLRRDSAPIKASHDSAIVAQVRRSSATSFDPKSADLSNSMSAIRPEEYLTVTPKPIMIPSPTDNLSSSSSSAYTRAKLSKFVSSSVDLPLSSKDKDIVTLETKRPEKPPPYQQALQRNFMLKHSVPVDIVPADSERQKEHSARAKALYEESLQLYDEQRRSKKYMVDSSPPPEHVFSEKSNPDTVIDHTVNSPGSDSLYSDGGAHAGFASPDNHQFIPISSSLDDSGASGYLDTSSLSQSLQEDILSRRSVRAGSDISSASRSINAAGSATVCRNDSKLSDTGSSSGSTTTVSTISKHSDSTGRRSDLSNASNITVSSVTSSDSNPDIVTSSLSNPVPSTSAMFKRKTELDRRNMAYSRHFRPVEPDYSYSQEQTIDMPQTPEEVVAEDDYVTLKKDPKQLYLESINLYEQKAPGEVASPFTSPPPSSSSSSSHTPPSRLSPQYSPNPQTSPTPPHTMSSVTSEQNTDRSPSAFRGRPMGSMMKSSLEVPSTALQRSRSDSAEHINKLGRYSPRSPNNVSPSKNHEQGPSSTAQTPVVDNSKESKSRSSKGDIRSEFRQKFLQAKSCFYQPEDDQRSSPLTSPRQHAQTTQATSSSSTLSSSFREQRHSKWPPQPVATPAAEKKPSDPLTSPRSSSNVPSKSGSNSANTSGASASDSKREFPWSVKDLKSIYDKDKSKASGDATPPSNTETTSHTNSQSRPRSPPPYQNPPPFRRLQDNFRQSTSSTSSGGSEQGQSVTKTSARPVSSHRHGPQSHSFDSYSSYSSSEEGYNSSLDRKSIGSRGSSQESEAINDYTNITYV